MTTEDRLGEWEEEQRSVYIVSGTGRQCLLLPSPRLCCYLVACTTQPGRMTTPEPLGWAVV